MQYVKYTFLTMVLMATALTHHASALDVNVPEFSQKAKVGQKVFGTICVVCHGDYATGTDKGPPLIHPFYRPDHHGDDAMMQAVKGGVIAHHWDFGDMPAVEGLSDDEIIGVVAFIRELQRANGIE